MTIPVIIEITFSDGEIDRRVEIPIHFKSILPDHIIKDMALSRCDITDEFVESASMKIKKIASIDEVEKEVLK